MSLQSEQPQPSIKELEEKYTEGITSMRDSEMPVMVPVKEKDWDTMVDLLEQVVLFQPEQIKALSELATKGDLSESLKAIRLAAVSEIRKTGEAMISENKRLKAENENLLTEIWDQLSQDGRNREQLSKDLKAEVSWVTSSIKDETKRTLKEIEHRPMTQATTVLLWILAGSALVYPWLSLLLFNWFLR